MPDNENVQRCSRDEDMKSLRSARGGKKSAADEITTGWLNKPIGKVRSPTGGWGG